MAEVPENPQREKRIAMEITVDAYGPMEQAMGWCAYLADTLTFPFEAVCRIERVISPLQIGDRIEIVGMAPEEECEHEMFVETPWGERKLAVPLAQLEPVEATDEKTREAVADWQYWVGRGYEFT